MRTDRTHSRGFTLTELMLTLAIVLVLACIAVPLYTGMRRAYRERTAIEYMRMIGSAANTYKTTSGTGSYPQSLETLYTPPSGDRQSLLPQPDEVDDLDDVFVSDWYITWWSGGGTNAFMCTATPNDSNNPKRLAVYEDGVVRMTTDGTTPTRTSPAVK